MRRRSDSGFALLLVFAMSAAIAIMLYRQLPRAAFEAQRSKEELLIDRGEQYTRAIQLYVSQWKRYPATIEDLEKSNNKRYLRRRYKDPMTGTAEWRLVHVDGNGMLTDSKFEEQEKKPNEYFHQRGCAVGSVTSPARAPNWPTQASQRGSAECQALRNSARPISSDSSPIRRHRSIGSGPDTNAASKPATAQPASSKPATAKSAGSTSSFKSANAVPWASSLRSPETDYRAAGLPERSAPVSRRRPGTTRARNESGPGAGTCELRSTTPATAHFSG
ncbi:MAG: hypothetical protein WKF37_02120 [Bryobacteraceae bacterium]